ncbi:hypothetical protein U91I_01239 [alpha proteobacterium U9-1i]|nr:hypothetical protein U91I_01239 [alpha proteobacterium U9-1i]
MTQSQRTLIAFYALVAIAALITTWGQNIAYFGDGLFAAFQSFALEAKANPASRSISVDIGFFLLAASAFMVIEARRLGVRFVWLYILGGFLIAISVTFALFMIARELRIARQPERGGAWSLTVSDLIGLALVAAAVLALSWFILT